MSRSLLRIPALRSKGAPGPRYRLAPRQDDLRFAQRRPGSWDHSVVEEDLDLEDSVPEDTLTREWTWAPGAGPVADEEFYGYVSSSKWKAKWWNPAAGLPQQPERRATVNAMIAELVASGQPKEEIYRAIREAYDVQEEDDHDGDPSR
ncbi:unnamed protein product [Effrenium voratum]|nr:unnamed protein product [Effrenium voratum]